MWEHHNQCDTCGIPAEGSFEDELLWCYSNSTLGEDPIVHHSDHDYVTSFPYTSLHNTEEILEGSIPAIYEGTTLYTVNNMVDSLKSDWTGVPQDQNFYHLDQEKGRDDEPGRTLWSDGDSNTMSTGLPYMALNLPYHTVRTPNAQPRPFFPESDPHARTSLRTRLPNIRVPSLQQLHIAYETDRHCNLWRVDEVDGLERLDGVDMWNKRANFARYIQRKRHSAVRHEGEAYAGWKRRLAQVSRKILLGGCATVFALGETDPGKAMINRYALFWHGELASTQLATRLLCVAGFITSISCLYHSNSDDKYQDRSLVLAVIVGTASGMLMGMSLQDAALKVLPWTVIVSLLASGMRDVFLFRPSVEHRFCEQKLFTGSSEKC